MEEMRNLTDLSLDSILSASPEAFLPLLTARKAQIFSTPKETFSYGGNNRHKLDVYFPSNTTTPVPILFFVYGGGFYTGSRDLVSGLLYDNIGAFFAQRGILTIVPDYRLMPETCYPGPAHDVRMAIQFVLSSETVDLVGNGGDKTRVYIMGHSAGAAISMTLFLDDDVMPAEERAIFKGVVLISGAYGSMPLIDPYYGKKKEEIERRIPLGLLRNTSPERIKQFLPPTFMLLGSRDVDIIVDWHVEFKATLHEKGFINLQDYTMLDHNHISTYFAIFSGEGEDWAEEVSKWIKTERV